MRPYLPHLLLPLFFLPFAQGQLATHFPEPPVLGNLHAADPGINNFTSSLTSAIVAHLATQIYVPFILLWTDPTPTTLQGWPLASSGAPAAMLRVAERENVLGRKAHEECVVYLRQRVKVMENKTWDWNTGTPWSGAGEGRGVWVLGLLAAVGLAVVLTL